MEIPATKIIPGMAGKHTSGPEKNCRHQTHMLDREYQGLGAEENI